MPGRLRWVIDGNHREGIAILVADNPEPPWQYPASADVVINPGVTLEIGCHTRHGNVTPIAAEGVIVAYEIDCEGMQLEKGTKVITLADLR